MAYLLDTVTCIDVLRKRPGMVARLSQVAPIDCAVSMVTVYELFCGLARAKEPAREAAKIEQFLSAVIELPFDRKAADAAAIIRADLERIGQIIGPYDLLIAGHAIAENLILVTNNVREFQRVKNLQVESWP